MSRPPTVTVRLWLALTGMALASVAAAAVPPVHTVGEASLSLCGPGPRYCGTVTRALDPTGAVPGRLAIGFEYYPHRSSGARRGVLVATEGGPGFATRESRADYLALFAPLRDRYDVLLMDNRGTGRSGAIDCPDLQRPDAVLSVDAVAACGAYLGPAAPLYSTSYASDDLAAILDRLRIERIALYGDSYGTFTAQTFAVRHPSRLEALVLDGAYPLDGPDAAWVSHYAPAMRDKFRLACARSARCAVTGADALAPLKSVLQQLRAEPHPVEGPDAGGNKVTLRADASALATVLFGAAPALPTLRESQAAAVAYLAGDTRPLVRLLAEAHGAVDSRTDDGDSRVYSAGAAAAVMCSDAPQIFDMREEPATRLREAEATLAARERALPEAYAPFTYAEYRGMPLDYAFLDQCVKWPAISAERQADLRGPAPRIYPEVPVLVLSGDLDDMTSVAEGARAAADFPRGHQVVLKNSLHVNALPRGRSPCAATLVRRFLQTGSPGDESCKDTVPAVPLAGPFVRQFDAIEPAALRTGHASAHELRLLAAAATASDVLARAHETTTGRGVGLRAGDFTVTDTPTRRTVQLTGVRWAEDLEIGGVATSSQQGKSVHADLTASSPHGEPHAAGGHDACGDVRVTLDWRTDSDHAIVRARFGGRNVTADTPFPY